MPRGQAPPQPSSSSACSQSLGVASQLIAAASAADSWRVSSQALWVRHSTASAAWREECGLPSQSQWKAAASALERWIRRPAQSA